jgi:hypothetical protein
MAFHRLFPGSDAHTASVATIKQERAARRASSDDAVRSERRVFNRLTALASWRSEYLLRTRLLRSIARGKPGVMPGVAAVASRHRTHSKKPGAVLTYYSKLPWMVTNLYADFSAGKKGPRVIHGASGLGIASASDPTTGKVEKWGLDDHFVLSQLEEVSPGLVPFGADGSVVAVPNSADVSPQYGFIGGEGFPGGRLFFRSMSERRGRYLSHHGGSVDGLSDIPKVPWRNEAVCSLWIAKSTAVPSLTQSTLGILAGSSLGVITSYALSAEFSSVYSNGDMTARWALCPGVPIVAVRVDDNYSARRKTAGRALAAALNALGEVFCLRQSPTPSARRSKEQDMVKDAWLAGRTVQWELIPATRRGLRDPDDMSLIARASQTESPPSGSSAADISYERLCAIARDMEQCFALMPADIKDHFEGWDMRRRLEIDFAGMDEAGLAEGVFVITCGYETEQAAMVSRYSRITKIKHDVSDAGQSTPHTIPKATFAAGPPSWNASSPALSSSAPSRQGVLGRRDAQTTTHEWQASVFLMPNDTTTFSITASAVDQSQCANLSWFDDPLGGARVQGPNEAGSQTPNTQRSIGEIPGRRARFLAVGTSDGTVVLWNMRDASPAAVRPLRAIQTQSPKISALALSALYVVHGGSDGLAQAWDPLASTLEPIRTLNARSSGRLPRQVATTIPPSMYSEYTAVGAIYLDPQSTVLRGVMAFGSLIRYWTYSSTGEHTGRKRRLRHSDIHGRLASRRQSGAVTSYIAAEEAELRREQDTEGRERARLQSRFGLGMGLTEEEAIRYAELVSEDTYADEQRRLSASDTGSTPEGADSVSASSSNDALSIVTTTPEPSMSGEAEGGRSPTLVLLHQDDQDGEFEQQMQRALRLSLLESESSSLSNRADYDVEFKYKPQKSKATPGPSQTAASPSMANPSSSSTNASFDEDLELALRLSMQDVPTTATPSLRDMASSNVSGNALGEARDTQGKGKGKEVV